MSSKRFFIWAGIVILAGVLAPRQTLSQAENANARNPELLLATAEHEQLVEGNLEGAIRDYMTILAAYSGNRTVAAKALLEMGQCYEKLGKDEARKAYERVLHDYADQQQAAGEARIRLAALNYAAHSASGALIVRRIWAAPEAEIGGTPSPDGRYLSFVDWSTGGDLAIRDLRDGTNRRVTNKGPSSDEWVDEGSVFSPDGRQLAYTYYDKDLALNLRVVGLDGSAARVLYKSRDMYYVQAFDWSPDGKNILAVLTGKNYTNQIAWISVNDGSTRVLRTLPWRGPGLGVGVSLSPDGHYIAYDFAANEDSDNAEIFLLAADGSSEVPLVRNPADNISPKWAPDGKHLLFLSDRTGTYGLWAIRVENGKRIGSAELVKSDVGRAEPMHFTHTGSFYYGVNTGTYDIYVATLDPTTWKLTAAPKKVAGHFGGVNSAPDWSPDGKYLVYTAQRKGLWPLWGPRRILIRSVETGEERELSTILDYYPWSHLRWSADGQSLLFAGDDARGREGVYVIDAQTGKVAQAISSEPGEETPQAEWSPDGRQIFYESDSKHENRLLLHDLQTGKDQELYRGSFGDVNPGEVTNFAVSRDGLQLALLFRNKAAHSVALKVLSVAGGEPRQLLQLPADGGFSGELEWSPDGRAIFFGKKGQGAASNEQFTELWQIPTDGGEPQKTGLAMEDLRDLRLDRDGRRIAFSAGTGLNSEVWAVENLLPILKAAK
jgi:Tol biopolymer transport system component